MFTVAAQQDVKIAVKLFQALIAYYLIWKQITLICILLVHKSYICTLWRRLKF